VRWLCCDNTANTPPETPSIFGEKLLNIEDIGTFSTVTNDPDNDVVYYLFDWGDGSDSGWLGSYVSGITCTSDHCWSESNIYDIKVKAKDENGAESSFSSLFSVQINCPPDSPNTPIPEQDKNDVSVTSLISWVGSDPDSEKVTYDVYFGTTNSPPKVASNQSDSTFDPGKLKDGTMHYWKIVTWDELGASTEGTVWSFTTQVDDESPIIEIIKPVKALYISNNKIRPYLIHKPLIIGNIDISVNADDYISGVERVEFYIDGDLTFIDTSEPYSWTWGRENSIRLRHTLEVFVYDYAGNEVSDKMNVWKLL